MPLKFENKYTYLSQGILFGFNESMAMLEICYSSTTYQGTLIKFSIYVESVNVYNFLIVIEFAKFMSKAVCN